MKVISPCNAMPSTKKIKYCKRSVRLSLLKPLNAKSWCSHIRKKMELQEDSKYKRCFFSKEFKLKVVKYYHDNMTF